MLLLDIPLALAVCLLLSRLKEHWLSSRHGLGYLEIKAPLQSVTARGQWNVCCRPALETAGCEHSRSSWGKLGAISVPQGLCNSRPVPSLLEQGSSQQYLSLSWLFVLQWAATCWKTQPAQSLIPNRPMLHGHRVCSRAGPGALAILCVHRHSVLCTTRVPRGGYGQLVSTRSSPAMQHSCSSSTGANLRGTSKEMQLSEAPAPQSIWRTVCYSNILLCRLLHQL